IGVLGEHPLDDRFAVLKASRHALILMTPPDHPWRGRAAVAIDELAGQPMVMREAGSVTRRAFDAALATAGITPTVALEIGSREAVREAVAAGLGLGVVQEPELGHDSRIGWARITGTEIAAGETVVCLDERRQSRLIQRLASIIADAG
ncbi:MAG: LysR substrate-binding domain-containing protein, partial [Alphaproteobacteria bacterium]